MKKIIPQIICFFIFANCAWAAQKQELRYISLAPSTTEILFALGLDKEVVGVTNYCDHPAKAKSKEIVGDFSHPNLEKIVSLKPDYIFCTGLEQEPTIAELRKMHFKVYIADPKTIDELLATITDIGTITHKEKEASGLVSSMKDDIETVKKKAHAIAADKKVKVYVEIWHEPAMTAGKGSFIDEMIYLANGINVSHDVIRPYCNFSPEKIVDLNPQVIILAYMDKESPVKLVERRLGWQNIDAVKNNRVFNDIPSDLLLRPGPRITQGLKALYSKLYPEK